MEPGHSIARLGFQRWHERQLLEAYGWLAVCFLSGLAFAAAVEGVFSHAPGGWPLVAITVAYFAGLACMHAWLRYRKLQLRADHFASRSTCEKCGRYGGYDVVSGGTQIAVRCKGCGHEWHIA